MKFLPALTLLLICSACIQLGNTPQPARYYLLAPQESNEQRITAENLTLALGPIFFPPYLDRPQLVTRNNRNEIVVAEFDRWAEPLQDNLMRVLKENLSRNLQGISVSDYPWQPTNEQGFALQLILNQFDGVLGQHTVVDIRWSLQNPLNNQELDRGHFVSRLEIGNSHQELVTSLNKSLNQFSYQIAKAVAKQLN